MDKLARLIALPLLYAMLSSAAWAITPAREREYFCPLSGEHFKSYGSVGSYTSFGGSLDFEPLVMGMLRSSLVYIAECPGSSLPLFREFSSTEITTLQAMVATSAWIERRALGNQHYLIAYARYVLGEGQRDIAQSLLVAVWTAKKENKAVLLDRAVNAWSRIADTVPRSHKDWLVANWLRVDLNRQKGAFEQADYWLRDFLEKAGMAQATVKGDMISLEQQLIQARDLQPASINNGRVLLYDLPVQPD